MKRLPKEVKAYIDALSADRAKRVKAIHKTVVSVFDDTEISMKYKMPTFMRGDDFFCIASQKNYVSVYTCSKEKIDPYLKKYPKTPCGKGCLNFKDSQEIDFDALKDVIRAALG